jgi:hypothetical protein
MLVAAALPEIAVMSLSEMGSGQQPVVPAAVSAQVAFCRVWCLVEIQAALEHGVPILMRCGNFVTAANNGRAFRSDIDTLSNMGGLVNVERAEAAVAADKDRILASVRAMSGGCTALDSLIRGAITGGYFLAGDTAVAAAVRAAACGEPELLATLSLSEQQDALYAAASGGFTRAVTALLAAGADVNELDDCEHSALISAAQGGHTDTIAALITAGAVVDFPELDGSSALLLAAGDNHVGAVAALLTAGAIVDDPDEQGTTSLMLAAKFGHADTVALLLAAGASLSVEDDDGDTAADYAEDGGHDDIAHRLMETAADHMKAETEAWAKALSPGGDDASWLTALTEQLRALGISDAHPALGGGSIESFWHQMVDMNADGLRAGVDGMLAAGDDTPVPAIGRLIGEILRRKEMYSQRAAPAT